MDSNIYDYYPLTDNCSYIFHRYICKIKLSNHIWCVFLHCGDSGCTCWSGYIIAYIMLRKSKNKKQSPSSLSTTGLICRHSSCSNIRIGPRLQCIQCEAFITTTIISQFLCFCWSCSVVSGLVTSSTFRNLTCKLSAIGRISSRISLKQRMQK